MPLTRLSLNNPAAVCVGIALIVLMEIMKSKKVTHIGI